MSPQYDPPSHLFCSSLSWLLLNSSLCELVAGTCRPSAKRDGHETTTSGWSGLCHVMFTYKHLNYFPHKEEEEEETEIDCNLLTPLYWNMCFV